MLIDFQQTTLHYVSEGGTLFSCVFESGIVEILSMASSPRMCLQMSTYGSSVNASPIMHSFLHQKCPRRLKIIFEGWQCQYLEKKTCIFVEFLLLTQVFQSTQWESL
jgi:hypothetical protein